MKRIWKSIENITAKSIDNLSTISAKVDRFEIRRFESR